MVATAGGERPRIVAAIDGGGLSAEVLLTAKMVAPLFRAEVGALHVFETTDDAVQARQRAAEAGVPLQVFEGQVVTTLASQCANPGVAGVVIGASAGRGAARALGHHALGLITATQRPVVVVPDGAETPSRLRRALLPLDAPLATQEALSDTVVLAVAADVDLIALHVWGYRDVPMFDDHPPHEWLDWSRDFISHNWPASVPRPGLQRRIGVPAEEIVAAVAETGADLLVLGWSQDLSLGRARVVRTALLESRRPVLLLPVRSHDAPREPELAGQPRREAQAAVVSAGIH
jgi:nucleotide-binding universal stress UspA family protein